MSDALTAIARDKERNKNCCHFLNLLARYLKKEAEDEKLLNQVIKAAEKTDAVKGGYFGSQTHFSKGLKERIHLLKKDDEAEWVKLLIQGDLEKSLYRRLKAISPFPNSILILVDYTRNAIYLNGEIGEFITEIIEKNAGYKTYDCDRYAVILPKPEIKKAKVIWRSCGIMGIGGPRKIKE